MKIDKLIKEQKITELQGEDLWKRKQELTEQQLPNTMKPRKNLHATLKGLKDKGYKLVCASNSIRKTVYRSLELLQVEKYFDFYLGNEDVENPKPSPDIYTLAMKKLSMQPENTLIVEDSPPGRKAAHASGAHVLEVEDPEDMTLELLEKTLDAVELEGKVQQRIRVHSQPQIFHVVIPMAGEGSRFKVAGYTVPKPFIPVGGKPMIRWVIENMIPKEIPLEDYQLKFHLIVRSSHVEQYDVSKLFDGVPFNISWTYHKTDGLTEGAACSVLLAEAEINNNEPLLIINSDQYLVWNPDVFYKALMNPTYDGEILTFYQPDPRDKKWSYAKVSEEGLVSEVAEKVWISPYATVGLYGWKRGSDFVRYAKQMIAKNIRVNNEFYVCPVYNESIATGQKVRVLLCRGMWGLGVPEDLEKFRKEFLRE
jgi:HAD superfamily hydrolase (TIGR01509 family)